MPSKVRARILRAAEAEFAECGFRGVSTRSIVRAADVHETSIFRLFETKEKLFHEVFNLTLERHLWQLLDQLGYERRGLHAFRHSAASVLIASSAPLPVMQRILGHASTSTTLGINRHVLGDDARVAVEKLGRILFSDVCKTEEKALQIN